MIVSELKIRKTETSVFSLNMYKTHGNVLGLRTHKRNEEMHSVLLNELWPIIEFRDRKKADVHQVLAFGPEDSAYLRH